MATLFARLPSPSGWIRSREQTDLAIEGMLAEPYLVGGRDRDDTAVMQATGDVVVKEGAEALDCAAVLSSRPRCRREDRGRVLPGRRPRADPRPRAGRRAGASHVSALADTPRPPVLGGGRPVGNLEPVFTLRRR